ncbi:hypothetical protein G6F57_020864 [Rhizopus arrhizus]|nr:hypothetical protein G6F57_020864 [Rhizopus arrhizus]
MTIPSSAGATVPSAPCTRDDADPPWRFFHHALTGLVPSGSGPPIHRMAGLLAWQWNVRRRQDGSRGGVITKTLSTPLRARCGGLIAQIGSRWNADPASTGSHSGCG